MKGLLHLTGIVNVFSLLLPTLFLCQLSPEHEKGAPPPPSPVFVSLPCDNGKIILPFLHLLFLCRLSVKGVADPSAPYIREKKGVATLTQEVVMEEEGSILYISK